MPILGTLIKQGVTLGQRFDARMERIKPIQHQVRVLRWLLRRAQYTSFGRYYDFDGLLREPNLIRAYQTGVPTFDYNTIYDRWWHMNLNRMEEDVAWPGRVRYFALSSGTSGAPSKYIPVTNDMFRAMRRAGLRMFFSLARFNIDPDLFTKGMMMLGGSSNLQDGGGYFAGDLSGINASRPPFWLRSYYKPGSEISRIASWDDRITEIAKNAPHWDIGFIVGIPSWLQLMMERIIAYHGVRTIHDIWPNLGVCVHGGIHFEPYRKSFEKLLERPLIYLDSYLASEGFIALQNRPETNAMRLEISNGIFFEFVPFNDRNFDEEGNLRDQPAVFTIDEVEEGIDYALLISTCAGAWRYLIGDTVRFVDKKRCEIIIAGRTKHYLSICGEHLSVDNMNQAVQYVESELDLSIPEFTVAAVEADNFFSHKWYLGCDPQLPAEKIAPLLDRRLQEVNDDYRVERGSVLRNVVVEVVPPSLFYRWQEVQGKMGGQHKFPRVMKKERFRDWEEFVRRHQSGRG